MVYVEPLPGLLEVVLFHLFRMCEEVVIPVRPPGVVALSRLIIPADARSCHVDCAAIVRPQVLAARLKLDVPVPLLDEDRDALVHQVPPDVVVVPHPGGLVQRERQVAAASGCTVFAENRSHG